MKNDEPSEKYPEGLCRKCGLCCHAKIIVGDEVFIMDEYCPYLDPMTNLCTVYPDRHEVNPQCLTVKEGIRARAFPADCPYVSGVPNYRPPKVNWSLQDIELARKKQPEKGAK